VGLEIAFFFGAVFLDHYRWSSPYDLMEKASEQLLLEKEVERDQMTFIVVAIVRR
jgi:hypothetical protein